MCRRYYALRRVNPYRGVEQIVDLGEAMARTQDGLTWHLSADDGNGLMRPVGVWQQGRGLLAGQPRTTPALIEAIEAGPDLPFAFLDSWELWLLDRERGLPLALLATDRQQGRSQVEAVEWYPFVLSYKGFDSPTLAKRDALTPYAAQGHRDILARMINRMARPYPSAQWFHRDQEGAGTGATGVRIAADWQGRRLTAECFPELLVKASWNSRLETSVIADYHAHLSPLLLLWPRLSVVTRARLELQACERPEWLARIHRLLPMQLQPERIRAALVAARLSQAASGPNNEWIED